VGQFRPLLLLPHVLAGFKTTSLLIRSKERKTDKNNILKHRFTFEALIWQQKKLY